MLWTRYPPSTGSETPVTNPEALSLARKSRAPASSRASPNRPKGVWAAIGEPAGLLVDQEGAVLLANEEARGDGVHADPVGRELLGGCVGQVQHRRLGRPVRPDAREGKVGGHRRQVDDRALDLP